MDSITMEVSESNFEADDHMSHKNYEPSLNLSLRPDSSMLEDTKEDDTNDEDDGSDQPEIEGPDIWCIHTVDDTCNFVGDSPFLVYYSTLLSLAKTNVPLTCTSKGCGTEISVCRQVVGSELYLKWVCENGHCAKKCCSQPLLNRQLHGDDLHLASTTLLSGSNFQKMVMFSKFLNLPILSYTNF
ncbi:hypothetical protein ACJMK2_002399 [Sinanodonta woodiana]|uniref:Uncharacterized protein n=1 Tax=Sinanodonta woodiana TaxID=1069815 RepID=A0ABD3XV63_SINWO